MFLDKFALILAIIGGLNWGSIGLFGFDLVGFLFGGQASAMSRIIFALVGLAALWCIPCCSAATTIPKIVTLPKRKTAACAAVFLHLLIKMRSSWQYKQPHLRS